MPQLWFYSTSSVCNMLQCDANLSEQSVVMSEYEFVWLRNIFAKCLKLARQYMHSSFGLKPPKISSNAILLPRLFKHPFRMRGSSTYFLRKYSDSRSSTNISADMFICEAHHRKILCSFKTTQVCLFHFYLPIQMIAITSILILHIIIIMQIGSYIIIFYFYKKNKKIKFT